MEKFFDKAAEPCSGGGKEPKVEESSDIVTFAREKLGFDPDAKQELVLRGGRRGIVNCTRQWGKSTVTAAKAVHRAYSVAGSLTLVVTPSGRQSGEFLRKAEEVRIVLILRLFLQNSLLTGGNLYVTLNP